MGEQQNSPPLKILFCDDGSEHAFAAARLICDLPLPPGSQVTALSVFPPTKINHYPTLRDQLEFACNQLRERGIIIEPVIKTGDPAETIIDMTEREKANLIIMGAVGLRATLGILLGGVAQKIVEYGNCPVLVVRAPYEGIHHVITANDGSPQGWNALEYLARFPLPPKVQVSVLHVLPPIYPEDFATAAWGMGAAPLPPIPPRRLSDEKEKTDDELQADALLEKSQAILTASGLSTECFWRRGDAATEILQLAKEKQASLIVVGSRGLSRVSAWLLGSVSRKIIHYAKCSVLVVRQPNGG